MALFGYSSWEPAGANEEAKVRLGLEDIGMNSRSPANLKGLPDGVQWTPRRVLGRNYDPTSRQVKCNVIHCG
jgi:hypothetical protein